MAVWSEVHLSHVEHLRVDAEFYQPKFLYSKQLAGNTPLKAYGASVIHPAEVKRIYSNNGLQVLLAQNNRDNYYDWSEKRFMPEKMAIQLSRNLLKIGDVTVTRSGANYGQTSVIVNNTDEQELYACADVLILKPGKLSGNLLSTYLNSKIGKKLMQRGVYGAGQPHVAPTYVREIPFPDYLIDITESIDTLIITSRENDKESLILYNQAQQLLETELGLDELTFNKSLSYSINVSEVGASKRLDSEFFDPVASAIVKKIESLEHVQLGVNCRVGNGFPWKSEKFIVDNSGEPVVRIRNIRPGYIDIEELTSIEPQYAQQVDFLKAKQGDVVIGMDGIKYFYASLLEGTCYVNQRVAHLTWFSNAKISPEYATFIINSHIGQAQLLRDMTVATTVGHITNRNISKLLIPYISDSFHHKITDLVRQSINKKQESKRLLEQAKTRVEQLIEQAVQS